MHGHQSLEQRPSIRRRYRLQFHLVTAAIGLTFGISCAFYIIPGHGAQAPHRLNITNAATSAP